MECGTLERGRSEVTESSCTAALLSLFRQELSPSSSTLPGCLTQHAADLVSLVRSIFSFHLCRNQLVSMFHQNTLNQIKACDFPFVFSAASRMLVDFFNDSLGDMQLCCGILCFQEMLCVGAGNVSEVRVLTRQCPSSSSVPLWPKVWWAVLTNRATQSLGAGMWHALQGSFKIRWFI